MKLRVPQNAGKLSSGLSSSAQLHSVSESDSLNLQLYSRVSVQSSSEA
jgi:hypothetical protein